MRSERSVCTYLPCTLSKSVNRVEGRLSGHVDDQIQFSHNWMPSWRTKIRNAKYALYWTQYKIGSKMFLSPGAVLTKVNPFVETDGEFLDSRSRGHRASLHRGLLFQKERSPTEPCETTPGSAPAATLDSRTGALPAFRGVLNSAIRELRKLFSGN